MSEELTEIVDRCLKDIRKEKETLESCLEKHKECRGELESLLLIAHRLDSEPPATASTYFKQLARQRLVATAQSEQVSVARPAFHFLKKKWPAGTVRRFSYQVVATALALVLLGGTATASAQSLPGSPFYPFKLAAEKVQLALTWNKEARVELKLGIAEKRFREAERLINKKEYSRADWALSKSFKNSEEARKLAQELSAEKKAYILTKLIQISQRQEGVLKKVLGQVPAQAKTAISHALEVNRQGLKKASLALQKASGKEKREEKILRQNKKTYPKKPSQSTPSTPERKGLDSGQSQGSENDQHGQTEGHN